MQLFLGMVFWRAMAFAGSGDSREIALKGMIRDSRDQSPVIAFLAACSAHEKGSCLVLASTQSDVNGRFAFTIPARSVARVEVSAPSFLSESISPTQLRKVAEQGTDLDIELTPMSHVS